MLEYYRIKKLTILDVKGNSKISRENLDISFSSMQSLSKTEFRLYFESNSIFKDEIEVLKSKLDQFNIGEHFILKAPYIEIPILLYFFDYKFITSIRNTSELSYLSFKVLFNSEVLSRLENDIFS